MTYVTIHADLSVEYRLARACGLNAIQSYACAVFMLWMVEIGVDVTADVRQAAYTWYGSAYPAYCNHHNAQIAAFRELRHARQCEAICRL